MKEILLCKQGELVLKGLNRKWFEDILSKRLRDCLKPYGNFKISTSQSTTYVEPTDDFADIDEELNFGSLFDDMEDDEDLE